MLIYGMPAYQLGNDDVAPSADVAKAALKDMRRSLQRWLKYRQLNDKAAAGKIRAKYPPKTIKVMLKRDWAGEQAMADQIHALLSEVFDASALPSPSLKQNPNAAVKLAKIAISGRLPTEAPGPQPQGIIWLWPMVVVAGIVAFTITSYVRTQAEVQMDKEHKECIKIGACTDYGFWIKAAAIGIGAYVAWGPLGLGKKIKGVTK